MPSVLWRCQLGGRKGIRPEKTEWWGVGVVICLERGSDLHMAQMMPLPLTVSCFSKIQIGFTFLVPADLGSPGKGPSNGCVCVCVYCLPSATGPFQSLDPLFGTVCRTMWYLLHLCQPFVSIWEHICSGPHFINHLPPPLVHLEVILLLGPL